MLLEQYIKPLPDFFSKTPILKIYKGFLLFRTIYFQKKIYENLLTIKPKHEYIGYLIHEKTHYKRMKLMGLLNFGIPYVFSKKRRFHEEFLAYKEQMQYLKSKKQKFDIEKVAKALSSWPYFWCTSYNEAKTRLIEAWNSF